MKKQITENNADMALDMAASCMTQHVSLHGGNYKTARLVAAARYKVDAQRLERYAREHGTKAQYK